MSERPTSPQALNPASLRTLATAFGLGVVAIAAIIVGTNGGDEPETSVAGRTELADLPPVTSIAPIGIEPRPADASSAVSSTTTSSAPAPLTTTESSLVITPVDVPRSGPGTYTYTTRPGRTFGDPSSSKLIQFSVAVEDGSGIDPDELADFVDLTLADERSWIGFGGQAFERIESGGLFTLVIAAPDTIDELCVPLDTAGRYSCARNGWVALNLDRWMNATSFWELGLTEYRHYLVNHEIGHYLGVQHVPCPSPGEIAPIMQQQTIKLDGCIGNGWPYPEVD